MLLGLSLFLYCIIQTSRVSNRSINEQRDDGRGMKILKKDEVPFVSRNVVVVGTSEFGLVPSFSRCGRH